MLVSSGLFRVRSLFNQVTLASEKEMHAVISAHGSHGTGVDGFIEQFTGGHGWEVCWDRLSDCALDGVSDCSIQWRKFLAAGLDCPMVGRFFQFCTCAMWCTRPLVISVQLTSVMITRMNNSSPLLACSPEVWSLCPASELVLFITGAWHSMEPFGYQKLSIDTIIADQYSTRLVYNITAHPSIPGSLPAWLGSTAQLLWLKVPPYWPGEGQLRYLCG